MRWLDGITYSIDKILSKLREMVKDWEAKHAAVCGASVVQSLSRVLLFVTPRTAANQASLSFTIFQSLLKLMSIESVMPSNHLILYHPFPALSLPQHQGLFQ